MAMPNKEFKKAVTDLNVVLKAEKKPVIKIVAVKKTTVIENFTNSILDFIENDNVAALPESVIDFYNEYIVVDADDDTTPVEETPAPTPPAAEAAVPEKKEKKVKKEKGTKEKKVKKEKKEKKVKEKKEKVAKAPGIIELGIKAWMEDGATSKQEIMDYVQPFFPERDITKTISHVYGIVHHIRPYDK